MAIQKNIITTHGIEVLNAYHRIEFLEIHGKKNISYRVRIYKESNGFPFFEEKIYEFNYDINGDNPIAQAYAHLKSLPEYADAVDC